MDAARERARISLSSSDMSTPQPHLLPGTPSIEDGTQGMSADAFKAFFRGHPAGVAVITADAGDGPVTLTATSVASVMASVTGLYFSTLSSVHS